MTKMTSEHERNGAARASWRLSRCLSGWLLACALAVTCSTVRADEGIDLSGPEQELEQALNKLQKAQRAQASGLVSPAWVEQIEHEVELARLALEAARNEDEHARGKKPDHDLAVAGADTQRRFAELEQRFARKHVDLARALADKGLFVPADLRALEGRAEQAKIAVALARLEQDLAAGKTPPAEYNNAVAPLMERRADLGLARARAEVEKMEMLFAAGQVTQLDVLRAQDALAGAESEVKRTSLEIHRLRGEQSQQDIAREEAALWAGAAEGRVKRCRAYVAACEQAADLGLTEKGDVEMAAKELAEAEEELKAAKEQAAAAKE
jgi:outer membrane protein TolC